MPVGRRASWGCQMTSLSSSGCLLHGEALHSRHRAAKAWRRPRPSVAHQHQPHGGFASCWYTCSVAALHLRAARVGQCAQGRADQGSVPGRAAPWTATFPSFPDGAGFRPLFWGTVLGRCTWSLPCGPCRQHCRGSPVWQSQCGAFSSPSPSFPPSDRGRRQWQRGGRHRPGGDQALCQGVQAAPAQPGPHPDPGGAGPDLLRGALVLAERHLQVGEAR